MIVKFTGPDHGVRLVDGVRSCTFHAREDAPGRWALMAMADGTNEYVSLEGPAYVMTDEGNTIDRALP